MKYILEIFTLFDRPLKRRFIALQLMSILMAFMEVAGVTSILPFLAIIVDPEIIETNKYLHSFYTFFSFPSHESFLRFTGFVLLGVLLSANILKIYGHFLLLNFNKNASIFLSDKLLNYYLQSNYLFFTQRNSSELVNNLMSEINRTVSGLILPFLKCLSSLLMILLMSALMLTVNASVSVTVFLIIVVFYLLIYKVLRKRMTGVGKLQSQSNRHCYRYLNETFSGVRDVKLRSLESFFKGLFNEEYESLASCRVKSSFYSFFPRYLFEMIAFGGIILMIILSLQQKEELIKAIPVFSFFILAGYKLLPAFQTLYISITQIKVNQEAYAFIREDLTSEHNSKVPELLQKTSEKAHDIRFKGVCFYYPNYESSAIFTNFDLTILHGQTIGFAGSSGSGKSTLIDLLTGLLQPSAGEVCINNEELKGATLSNWRESIGYVSQSIFLADTTLAENIAFGVEKTQIDMARVDECGRVACLDEYTSTLKNGYNTIVGERGMQLSGGQRQRIGLARALYHQPEVLILDEATSALDCETENKVLSNIKEFFKEKTVIMIAHRLTTLKDCDTIYILQAGEVADSGNYSYLKEKSSLFKAMENND